MDSLRVSLIIIGAIILLLLYLGSRFLQGRKSQAEPANRSEPSFAEQLQSAEQQSQSPEAVSRESVGEPLSQPAIAVADAPAAVDSMTANDQPPAAKVESPVVEAAPVSEPTPELTPEPVSAPVSEPAPEPTAAAESPVSEPVTTASTLPEVIALHVVAGDEPFRGTDLVRAANLAAMRYGEMEIFHFQGVTKGDITFGMANMLEPGTFDMDQLEAFSTPGVLLFMESRYQADIARSLESMAKVAQRLCEVLDGQLRDGRRQPMAITELDSWKSQLLGNS